MKHLIRKEFLEKGYVFATRAAETALASGHTRPARLASNENPYPPSPKAVKAAADVLPHTNRYPDETNKEFIDALKKRHGDYRFVASVGMDGIIDTVIRTLVADGDRVAVATPTYSYYGLAVQAQGGVTVSVPRKADFSVDPATFCRDAAGTKLAFLCTPNNPTGTTETPETIAEICENYEGVLFLDCAYIEFDGTDYRPLMRRYWNLIIGRTMSKAYSLAGLRVGYAFVPEWYGPVYQRAATPFTLNMVSQAAAAAALRDTVHVKKIVSVVQEWRQRFIDECPYPVVPGGANFVMVDVAPQKADDVVTELAKKGVIVRSCASFPGLPDHYIRVSIGEPWENEAFIAAITDIYQP
ncbi:histidinol-phosphate transaminase [Methanogenium sp. MK-MG]|uniref:pyridoxal phosphate-dependent aminotransferase n=1 Tax=Methanogenium sp. MK-MG TaxID=2599926 RepID=UPI0013EBB109|nr:histidinol-phosphate transaminase [Methanogenium sp. MK-MG]KAF1078484.1 Histidinol-phosphate aminotransferase [Methanogenium sp. MK-MG]